MKHPVALLCQQGSTLFLMTVIQLSGYLDAGNLNPAGAYFWLTVMLTTSFFTGVWGLFVLFGITNSNGLLIQHQFVKKALVLKIPMVLINIQVKCMIKISYLT